jgi:hypothetical protein
MDFRVPGDKAQDRHTRVGVLPVPLRVFFNESQGWYHVVICEKEQVSPGFSYGEIASCGGASMVLPEVTNRSWRCLCNFRNDGVGSIGGPIVNNENLRDV